MANDKNRLGKIDSIVSLAEWAWRNISSLVTALVGGGLMTRWAAATEWAQAIGPLGWGMVGLATFLVILATMTWFADRLSMRKFRDAQASIARKLASSATVNPLDQRFERQQVRLADFISPDGAPVVGKRFENCDLLGPMAVFLVGDFRYQQNLHSSVEFVKIGNHVRPMPNKLILQDVEIRNCRIYNVVFLVAEAQVPGFEAGFDGGLPWLN